MKQCNFTKSNGDRCNAWAMADSEFCFTHNPKTEKLRELAATKGGKGNKKNHEPLDAVKIKDNKDVVSLIVKTINELRQGSVDVRIANCIFYGSGQLIKALEIADLEDRMAKIEKILSEK